MLGSSLLISLDNDAPPYIRVPPRSGAGIEDNLSSYRGKGLVVTLTAFRLEARFVVEITPWVIGPNLVSTTGDPDNAAPIHEMKFEVRLLVYRLS
jgi:hypothetical protein